MKPLDKPGPEPGFSMARGRPNEADRCLMMRPRRVRGRRGMQMMPCGELALITFLVSMGGATLVVPLCRQCIARHAADLVNDLAH